MIGFGISNESRSSSMPVKRRTPSTTSAGGDGAVELALVAGLGRDHDPAADQLGGKPLRLFLGLSLGLDAGFADGLGLGQGRLVGLDRLLPRQQVIAGVTLGHVHDIAPLAQLLDIGSEDEPHLVLR